jgi:TatD DNase family protein
MHCFTESLDMAKAALDLGFYISFSGIITFKSAMDLRAVAAEIPADRILVETDSPWLAPVPHRGLKNEPQYVVEVAQCLAEIRGIGLDELAKITTQNFQRLFKLPAV